MSMKAVVLAAGKGTRMQPLTDRRPKPLVPVAGRPIIEHIIGGLAAGGFDRIGLVVGYKQKMIREALGDGGRLGASIEYITQREAGGTGAATLLAEEFVGDEPFFLGWGDIIVPRKSYREIRDLWAAQSPQAILSVNYVDDPWEGAAVYVSGGGHVERIEEKPAKGTATTNFNNAGLFVFQPEIIDLLRKTEPSSRGEVEVPSAVDAMLSAGARISAYEIDGYWSDVARPSSALCISGQMIEAASRDGIVIHPDARVSTSAELIGPVYIGAGAQVAGAKLGPNVTVMPGCDVGVGAKLAETCLLAGSSVGRDCALEHAVVEEGVEVPDGRSLNGTPQEAAIAQGG